MNITIVFFLGLILALVGVIPPGLLNMSAAKISLKEGYSRGIMFSVGVCITVIFQTYIAAIFARYISNQQDVVDILQRVAFVVFVLITVYYLLIAKKESKVKVQTNIKSKHSRLFQGMLLGGINLLPIPYHAYMTTTLASLGLLSFEHTMIYSYVAGATTGTFVMLYVYIFFFEKVKGKNFTSQKNMNYWIGSITGIIAVITLINILKEL
ncbi:lysine transporter LysE [Flavobacteriaceae bacterium LMO-SS05]